MNDQEFDKLLYQRATDLSPEPLSGPWRRALGFICWSLILITVTLSVLSLQYILPALGSLLLYLGFRSLRKPAGPWGCAAGCLPSRPCTGPQCFCSMPHRSLRIPEQWFCSAWAGRFSPG